MLVERIASLAAFLTCLGCSGPAQASDWLEVGVASNGAKLYVDARSLRGGDGSVRLDQRFLFPEGRHRLSRVDQQVVYSCKSKTVRTLRSVEFDRSGRVAHRGGANAVPPYEVTPGTLPEYVLELVC